MNRKTGINTSFLFISLTDNWKKAVKREIIFAEHVAWILTHFSARGKGRIRRPMVCWSVFFISFMISTCKQLQHTPRFHSVANGMALLQIFVKFGTSETWDYIQRGYSFTAVKFLKCWICKKGRKTRKIPYQKRTPTPTREQKFSFRQSYSSNL